jgi:hypothetical protein
MRYKQCNPLVGEEDVPLALAATAIDREDPETIVSGPVNARTLVDY